MWIAKRLLQVDTAQHHYYDPHQMSGWHCGLVTTTESEKLANKEANYLSKALKAPSEKHIARAPGIDNNLSI